MHAETQREGGGVERRTGVAVMAADKKEPVPVEQVTQLHEFHPPNTPGFALWINSSPVHAAKANRKCRAGSTRNSLNDFIAVMRAIEARASLWITVTLAQLQVAGIPGGAAVAGVVHDVVSQRLGFAHAFALEARIVAFDVEREIAIVVAEAR